MFDEKFWLAIAFFVFAALIIRHVMPIIMKQLDSKSKQIAEELLAAKEMKENAARLLENAKKRYEESAAYANQLIKDSAVEAQKYFEESLKAAETEIAKKMTAVENRIKQEQESAVREMKVKIIEGALAAVHGSLQNVQKDKSDILIKKSVNDLSKMVH